LTNTSIAEVSANQAKITAQINATAEVNQANQAKVEANQAEMMVMIKQLSQDVANIKKN